MNTLRRLTSTPSFRRFWPLLRAEYNPNFQSFCERLLRVDADDPRLVELVLGTTTPSPGDPYAKMLDGQISSAAKQVQDVAAEFAREWPEFVSQEVVVSQEMGNPGDELIERLGPLYVHQLIQLSAKLVTADHASYPSWLIVQPPKHHVPAREHTQDFIVGILIITRAEKPADGYNLFYWIRPAHRSSGIGEKIILNKKIKALDWQLSDLANDEGKERDLRIHVRYPATGVRDDAWSRKRWFNFFAKRWFNFFALYDNKPELEASNDNKPELEPATGVRDDAWSRKRWFNFFAKRWFNFFALYDNKPELEASNDNKPELEASNDNKPEHELEHELEPGKEWVLSRPLDTDVPRLVELVPSTTEPGSEKPFAKMLDGQIVSMTKEVEDVAAEFAREWPEFVSQEVVVSQEMGNPGGGSTERLGPLYVHQLIQLSAKVVTADHASCPSWLIVQPPKPSCKQKQDCIVGILIITPATEPADDYNLFYWIRPAHRSSGIGEWIIRDKKTLDRQLTALAKQGGVERTPKLRVCYPATEVRDDAGDRKRWLSFFSSFDFKSEHKHEPGKEWVLSRPL